MISNNKFISILLFPKKLSRTNYFNEKEYFDLYDKKRPILGLFFVTYAGFQYIITSFYKESDLLKDRCTSSSACKPSCIFVHAEYHQATDQ